jgi:hypothetical protein
MVACVCGFGIGYDVENAVDSFNDGVSDVRRLLLQLLVGFAF